MQDVIRMVQITDTHLFEDTSKRLLGLNTQDSFEAVLKTVAKEAPQRDLILLTGDLAQDYLAGTYKRLAKQISTLHTRTYWTTGNHDNLETLRESLKGPMINDAKSIVIKNWHLILLDTLIPGEVPGMLSKTELNFLETSLKKHPQHHTLIGFHHQPLPTGSRWLDNLGLLNAPEFFEIIDRYKQVRCVLYGHIHQTFTGQRNDISYLATPSTCIQFKQHSDDFALDIVPPGFRWLELTANGAVRSDVMRVKNFAAYTDADPKSRGY